MASVNWQKYKGGTEAKSHFRHNETEQRTRTGRHSNPDIDKSRTPLNFSVVGRNYNERCDIYDKAISGVKRLRSDAVTCIGLEVTVPQDLPEDKYKDWFTAVHGIYCDFFGADNVIDTDIHFDEIHDYYDPTKKQTTKSRVHAHTNVMPFTEDGRLCCKEIFTRANLVKLNDAVEEMTQRDFGCKFMTGETPRKESVEQLKAKSLQAQNQLVSEQIEQTRQQVNLLCDTVVDSVKPEKTLFGKKTGRCYMDERTHDDFMQAADDMRRLSSNTLTADVDRQAAARDRKAAAEDRKAAAAERAAAEKLKQQEQARIKALAQKYAEQIAQNAVAAAKKREQEADEKAKEYTKLLTYEKKLIRTEADKIAQRVSASYSSQDIAQRQADIDHTIEVLSLSKQQAPQPEQEQKKQRHKPNGKIIPPDYQLGD